MTTDSAKIPEAPLREDRMVGLEGWEEIRRLATDAHWSVSEIARRLEVDRKTVRKWLREPWKPYQRAPQETTLLTAHAAFLRTRAPEVQYSARILFQELHRQQGYRGSYDTVKRFVQPLRAQRLQAERATVRFETEPGHQSQIDWGQAQVALGTGRVVRHFFVLTLGFSRRGFYRPSVNESLGALLEAHERAFDYFGGHTREHLYDRMRTVCLPGEGREPRWHPTFAAFARHWSFEPRVCQPYRARTKGKVESGVRYLKMNFLPGRTFRDDTDLEEQLQGWMSEIADTRIHGTTHQRPIDRFQAEAPLLIPTTHQPSFRLEATWPRVVATDYLVSVDTNRYSVPCTLIGQTVDVTRRNGEILIHHRGQLVATHPECAGRYQLQVLPDHGPGPVRRNARTRYSSPPPLHAAPDRFPMVEVRDLEAYAAVAGGDA